MKSVLSELDDICDQMAGALITTGPTQLTWFVTINDKIRDLRDQYQKLEVVNLDSSLLDLLPSAITKDANEAIEEMLRSYHYPSNTQNAGRAGWEAAREYLMSRSMVDTSPPASSRDRWMYEQGRLAERDARTKPDTDSSIKEE